MPRQSLSSVAVLLAVFLVLDASAFQSTLTFRPRAGLCDLASTETAEESIVSADTAELAQRKLLEARLKMQLRTKGRQEQAAHIQANFIAIETTPLEQQQAERESKQNLAAGLLRNMKLKDEAQLQQEERLEKQARAETMVKNAQRLEEAAEAKATRESLQSEAASRIRLDRLHQQAEKDKAAREDKQAQALEILAKQTSPEAMAEKYAAIDDVGERAYEILKDLGTFA